MKSSIDSAMAISAAPMTTGRMIGRVTVKKACKRARAEIARALDHARVEIDHARMHDQDDERLREKHMAEDDRRQAELEIDG